MFFTKKYVERLKTPLVYHALRFTYCHSLQANTSIEQNTSISPLFTRPFKLFVFISTKCLDMIIGILVIQMLEKKHS